MTTQSGFISLMNDGLLVIGVVKSSNCFGNGDSDALFTLLQRPFLGEDKTNISKSLL